MRLTPEQIIHYYYSRGGGGPVYQYTPEYQAVQAYCTQEGIALPSEAGQQADDQLIVELKATGIWGAAPVVYNFLTEGNSDYACINLKNPGTHNCLKVNSPSYTSKQGFKGNGSTSYLNSQWNASTHHLNLWTINDAGYVIVIGDDITMNGAVDFGSREGSLFISCNGRNASGQWASIINGSSGSAVVMSVPSSNGISISRRQSASDMSLKRGLLSLSDNSSSSAGIPSNDVYICCRNERGVAELFSPRLIQMLIPFKQSLVSDADIEAVITNHINRISSL